HNYNSFKGLGKSGDSFNNVIHGLLHTTNTYNQTISEGARINGIIEINIDNKSFFLKINSGLHKVGINKIICF
ncbi:MAG: hypothetical protein L0H53_11380, partial [Candidatus Nitrosocosmicus sp.]|nr:hypothetical protein [Candidatus Nitrosocosmicus sp.]